MPKVVPPVIESVAPLLTKTEPPVLRKLREGDTVRVSPDTLGRMIPRLSNPPLNSSI